MLKKRLAGDFPSRSLPQRKNQFNIPGNEMILPRFTTLRSNKFHPYLNSLDVAHLHSDVHNTLIVAASLWKNLSARLYPKRALISFILVAFTLLGMGNSHDYRKIALAKGTLLASTSNTTQMAAVIVADNVPHFQWPLLGHITTQYSRWHPGIDLPQPKGTPIHPIASGMVTAVENSRWGYGKSIIVIHSAGYASRYAHLSKTEVKVGDHVTSETTLGGVGNTGRSTGNHLHLEIYADGKSINPKNILPTQESVASANH